MVNESRKNYNVSLNAAETKQAQEQLDKCGMSLSGFFRAAITEFLETVKAGEAKKGFNEMSASEFLEAVETMKKRMKDE